MNRLHNRDLGREGERKAVRYLKRRFYKILGVNVRTTCEMDIICQKNGVVCFVEVKTRESARFGLPREAVTEERKRRYRTGATAYLKQNGLLDARVRFDVIEILNGKITHIKDAF